MASFAETYRELFKTDPPPLANPRLKEFWTQDVWQLCELPPADRYKPEPGWDERHRLYLHLLAALIHRYWNGWKYGRPADPKRQYPLNEVPGPTDRRMSGDFYGYNIAALATDASGRILDFDFNHNELFGASTEHAEARLARRLFALAQVSDSWGALPAASVSADGATRRQIGRALLGNEQTDDSASGDKQYTKMSDVTVYTSLEPCSQCAGVMALAGIQTVVYMQTDPGMYFISRILRNLTPDELRAPRPVSGAEVVFGAFAELDRAYEVFCKRMKTEPFYLAPDGKWEQKPSITSFLCTKAARVIFERYGKIPDSRSLAHPDFRGLAGPGALTNADLVGELVDFLDYADKRGRRGTPHNL